LWEKIEAAHPGKRIVHICDNAAYYRSNLIKEWLHAHRHVRVVYLPPYSPNLNPIERGRRATMETTQEGKSQPLHALNLV
jgi:transposase